MSVIQTTSAQPWISLWISLTAAPRRLARRWSMARLHRRRLEQLATLSDHQLHDVGLEESPYHEGSLRDACNLKACLADRWTAQFVPDSRPRRWL